MNLVLHTHPEFVGSRSQQHFARMLMEAFRARGHTVSLRQPRAVLRQWVTQRPWAKWAGYVDQYLLFPRAMRRAMQHDPAGTLYVFCDQAVGPWVPHAAHRPHVVHCHDLLALRSALGDIAENPTSWTGQLYQRYIRHGFRRARHFISISQKSRADLHRFGGVAPVTSEVVYNGLNHPYRPLDAATARALLQSAGLPAEEGRCLLHIGGGQWYKNQVGVVLMYAQHVRNAVAAGQVPRPLWMVSPPPNEALRDALAGVPAAGRVEFVQGLDNAALEALYNHADALLFPSLDEGFGWPIAEAMACGCPVITTGAPPMNEVGGDVAAYVPRLRRSDDADAWARLASGVLECVLQRSPQERERAAAAACAQAAQFTADAAIRSYLAVYERVLAFESAHS